MSAYLVDDATLDVIVRAAIRFKLVRPASASLVGQALRWENIASVSHRYPNDALTGAQMPGPTAVPPLLSISGREIARDARLNPSTYSYTPRNALEPRLDLRAVLGCIECLNYQSCEHPGWPGSASQRLLNQLTRAIQATGVTERREGDWGVSTIAEAHEMVGV